MLFFLLTPCFELVSNMSKLGMYFYLSIPILAGIVGLFVAIRKHRKRDSKNYSNDFISASVVLGSLLIFREDERSVSQKLHWTNRYLRKNFSNTGFNVFQIYQDVVQMGVDIKEYSDLANERLSERQRIDLLEFLIRLGNTNGSINARESEFIFYLLKRFKLNLNDLDQVVQNLLIPKKDSSETSSGGNKSYYFKILGIQETADLQVIKDAYRKLVKVYHPDNNGQLDEQQKKEQVAKFLEIQRAYEILSSQIDGQ